MNEELIGITVQMISAAGAARAKYIEAIAAGKDNEYEKAQTLLIEGSTYFAEAHKAHAQMLATESDGIETSVSLLLVHAEDQMMCAETFRLVAEEFIDVYKKLQSKK